MENTFPNLSIKNLLLRFGGLLTLRNVSMEVKGASIVAVIGPNGAGKTSLLNCISGFYKPEAGEIFLGSKDITGWRPDKISRLGVARTFQIVKTFGGLTVVDNIMTGRHVHFRLDPLAGAIFFGRSRREEIRHRKTVEEIINFLEIKHIRNKIVGSLPAGLQRRVELARALALEPNLLLLDEPMAGMNLEEKEDMARFVLDIRDERRIPIIMVEHDMEVVMDIAEKVIVLNFGNKIAEGSPGEIKNNPEVVQAYLGAEENSK